MKNKRSKCSPDNSLVILFILFLLLPLAPPPARAASYAYLANSGGSSVAKMPMAGGGEVNVGSRPWGVAASPDGKYFYVSNSQGNSVSRIEVATLAVNQTIVTGGFPRGLAVSPDGKYVYGADYSNDRVFRIEVSSGTVDRTVAVGDSPMGVAVSPDGRCVYVTNYNENTVSRINVSTAAVDKTISVGSMPDGVAVSPDGRYVYVANYDSDDVSRINVSTAAVDKTISVDLGPVGVAVSRDGKYVYTANYVHDTVSRIDASTNLVDATITVGDQPEAVAVSPDGKYVYVTNYGDHNVSRIDASLATPAVDKTTDVGFCPRGVTLTPDGRYLAVCNYGPDSVTIFDLAYETISVGTGPLGVAAGPNGQYAWVSNNGTNTVSKVNVTTDAVEATITVGTAPYGLAATPDGKYVFVANSADDTVSRIDTTTNLVDATIAVGDDPRGVSVTPDGAYVIVANYGDSTITRIAIAYSSAMVVPTIGSPFNQPISLGNFITPDIRGGNPGNDGDDGDEELDTRPPGGPAHQIGGGGNNMDPPIPPNHTWEADQGNGTFQALTMGLLHTGVNGDGVSAEARVLDIQVPGLIFQQTCPAGTTQQSWLALGEAGTTPSGVEYSTSMRWNYDVRVIDVAMDWPQSVLQTMAAGKHCLCYWLQTEDGSKSNCRVGYLNLNPNSGTASISLDSGTGVVVPRSIDQLTFKVQFSYFNEDTGLVDRVSEGMCTVETEQGTWGTYPITDGLLTFTIPFGVTSEIGFTSQVFNGTKTVRIEFVDGYMYCFDQDHRDAVVEVYLCTDNESYAMEYYQDLVYICNQGDGPDGPILGRMYGK